MADHTSVVIFGCVMLMLFAMQIFVIYDGRKKHSQVLARIADMENVTRGLSFDKNELSIAIRSFESTFEKKLSPIREEFHQQSRDLAEIKSLTRDAAEKLANISSRGSLPQAQ
jgi:hypothetical protein